MEQPARNAVEELLRRIARLPHAAIIRPEDALRWVRAVLARDPGRAAWHVARAGGIGGSEAGAIMAWAYGEHAAREGADRLARRKLLQIPPDASNDDTARGIRLEPHIREVYEERLTREGRVWRRRDDLQQIVEAGPHPEMPWLRASLDGLYEIDRAIVIPDFKAPSEAVLEGYVRHHDYHEYRAQLNHYATVAEGRGVRIDALHLAFYDYRHVASAGVQLCEIDLDRTLQDKLVAAADDFWNNHVIRGEVPQVDRERLLTHPDVPLRVETAARRAVAAKILGDQFMEAYEESRQVVTRWVRGTGRIAGGMLPLGAMAEGARGLLEVRARKEMDVPAAVARLRDLGMPEAAVEDLRGVPDFDPRKARAGFDASLRLLGRIAEALEAGQDANAFAKEISDFRTASATKEKAPFDSEKISLALESFGESPYHFLVEQVAATLPRGKPQDVLELKEMLRAEGTMLMNSLVACERVAEELPQESPEGLAPGR